MTESKGGQHNMTQALNSNTAPRPDWLLYVIPSIAFVFGVLLFSMVYKTQRRREKMFRRVAALKTVMNSTATGHTYSGYTSQQTKGESKDIRQLQSCRNSEGNLKKQEAQSYENVTSIIYNNEEKVNYCLRQDADYITPDGTDTDNSTYLQPLKNLRETESYENMDGCVYSHPRQPRLKNALSTGDDDYVDPDVEGKRNLEQTDTESYENMAGSICPGTRAHTSSQTVDEGWYECMDRRQGLT
ncbi:uncharacterized protein Hap1MRO34_002724 [Clarias gariepinus]|uniref:uncharacterized protein LOC128516002 n=1 Tax=Clarias gariepinus TaxID=13013 RepID=UPI00234CFF67|nr:uncharacterized protein LOC128516002 [Clarias gariepinus]